MTEASLQYWAVFPAAGVGQRMGAPVPKQYLSLQDQPVIVHALSALLDHPKISGGVVAISPEDTFWPKVSASFSFSKPLWVTFGGATRAESVQQGLITLAQQAAAEDWVLVHDAARPCLAREDVDRLIDAASDDPVGGVLATPVRDTLKFVDDTNRVSHTVDRSRLWHALTPQMFRLSALQTALSAALLHGEIPTDEASVMEWAGHSPKLVQGRADNLKITQPEDLAWAEFYLGVRFSP